MCPPRETIPLTRDEPERQKFIIVFIFLFYLDERLDARLRVRGRQCRVQAETGTSSSRTLTVPSSQVTSSVINNFVSY
jgi:hypothetical protein